MTTFSTFCRPLKTALLFLLAQLVFQNSVAAQVFGESQIIAPAPVSAHAIDFDGDGKRDLLTVSAGTTFWHQNLGGGQFAPPAEVPAVSLGSLNGTILEVIDFDFDGDEDLVAVQNGNIFWQENLDGKGSFGARIDIGSQQNTVRLWIYDLDFDGDYDILPSGAFKVNYIYNFLNSGDNKVFIKKLNLITDPQPNLSSCVPFSSNVSIDALGLFDIFKDSQVDAFTINRLGSWDGKEVSILSDGNGGFSTGASCLSGISGYDRGTSMKGLLDINGDKYLDLIGLNYYQSSVTGSGTSSIRYMASGLKPYGWWESFSLLWKTIDSKDYDATPTNGIFLPSHSAFMPIDIEKDGDVDILSIYDRQILVHLNSGFGNFSTFNAFDSLTFWPQPLLGWDGAQYGNVDFVVADLDSDGFDDVACIEAGNLVWFKNQFHGKFFANVQGKIFWDKNENGSREADETDLFFQKVQIQPSNLQGSSLSQPEYEVISFSDGIVSLSCQPAAGWKLTTASPVQFSIGKTSLILHDFGLAVASIFPAADIRLTSSPTRCASEVPFWLSIRNTGTQFSDGKITLPLSPFTQFSSAEPAPAAVQGNVLTFNFEDLPPTHELKIKLILKIADASQVGQPIKMSPKIELTDAGGAVVFSGEGNFESVVRCSFDPNDKLIFPNQGFDSIFTFQNREIEYTIRFQNTGNDTAFDVKILDRLHPHLDWSSFRPISSSHPFTFDLARDGSLTFLFEKINLPDSATNAVGSQGFVRFGISPRAGLPSNSKILNHAKIIFDKNPPITTNVVRSFVRPDRFVASLVQPVCPYDSTGSIRLLDAFGEDGRFEFRWAGFSEKSNFLQHLPSGKYPVQIVEKASGTVVFEKEILLLAKNDVDAQPKIVHSVNGKANGQIDLFPTQQPYPPFGTTYLWNTVPPQTTSKIQNLTPGTYQCTLTFPGGCTKVYTFVIETSVGTGAAADFLTKFEVLPNPNAGDFQVVLEIDEPNLAGEIEVFNSLGIVERRIALPANGLRERRFFVEGLAGGVHFVSLRVGGERVSRRVLVLKN